MKSQLIIKVITIHSLWAMNPMTCNHPQLWSGQSNCNVVAAICVHLQVFFLDPHKISRYRRPANTMWGWGLRSTPSSGLCINHRSLRAPELGRRWPWNAEPESWCSTVKCKVSPHSLTCSECVSAQLNTSRLTVSSCDCLEAPWLNLCKVHDALSSAVILLFSCSLTNNSTSSHMSHVWLAWH